MELLRSTIGQIGPLDEAAMQRAQERLNQLLKPPGSLGRLEWIARRLAGISGRLVNELGRRTIIVMAADNGVTDERVSAFPAEVSALVAGSILDGLSGVAVLAAQAGAKLKVVDLGLREQVATTGIIDRKFSSGSGNIARGPAMSRAEARQAIEVGIEVTCRALEEGAQLLGTGEVGIGNTTTSSAVLYALTGENPVDLVGRGTGVDDATLLRKREVVKQAVAINQPDKNDPIDVVAKVGGFDLAGLMGCYLAAAARRVPIVIDGFISGVAALLATRLVPLAGGYLLPSHSSAERGSQVLSRLLGLEPFLQMEMRLGEGTGCALAFQIIDAANAMMAKMGTFQDVGL